jgi:hypothetical protein
MSLHVNFGFFSHKSQKKIKLFLRLIFFLFIKTFKNMARDTGNVHVAVSSSVSILAWLLVFIGLCITQAVSFIWNFFY